MKTALKIVSALLAVAGIVYVIAAYGDKIVAWAKKFIPCCADDEDCALEEDFASEDEDTPAEEVPAEEAPAAEEEEPAPVVSAEDGQPVAEDKDFEG